MRIWVVGHILHAVARISRIYEILLLRLFRSVFVYISEGHRRLVASPAPDVVAQQHLVVVVRASVVAVYAIRHIEIFLSALLAYGRREGDAVDAGAAISVLEFLPVLLHDGPVVLAGLAHADRRHHPVLLRIHPNAVQLVHIYDCDVKH